MRKKYKVGLIVISVLLLGVISLGVLRIFYHEEEEKRVKSQNVVDASDYVDKLMLCGKNKIDMVVYLSLVSIFKRFCKIC